MRTSERAVQVGKFAGIVGKREKHAVPGHSSLRRGGLDQHRDVDAALLQRQDLIGIGLQVDEFDVLVEIEP